MSSVVYHILGYNVCNASNKSPTRCNNFPVYYPDVYLQLNMFRAISRPSSGTRWLQWQPVVLPSYRGDSRAVFVIGPVIYRLLLQLLGSWWWAGRMPETCWAVNKHQDNKLENCCIWLVIYLNCTMMHGLTYLKFVTLVVSFGGLDKFFMDTDFTGQALSAFHVLPFTLE